MLRTMLFLKYLPAWGGQLLGNYSFIREVANRPRVAVVVLRETGYLQICSTTFEQPSEYFKKNIVLTIAKVWRSSWRWVLIYTCVHNWKNIPKTLKLAKLAVMVHLGHRTCCFSKYGAMKGFPILKIWYKCMKRYMIHGTIIPQYLKIDLETCI